MWLKISFAPYLDGEAYIGNSRKPEPGQWFVFDKKIGHIPVLFKADTFDKCARWIDLQRRECRLSDRPVDEVGLLLTAVPHLAPQQLPLL